MFRTWMRVLPYFVIAWAAKRYLAKYHDDAGGTRVEPFTREVMIFYKPLGK